MTEFPYPATIGSADEHIAAMLEVLTLMIRSDGTADPDEIGQFMGSIEAIGHQASFDSIGNDHLFRLVRHPDVLHPDTGFADRLERLKDVLEPRDRQRAYDLSCELIQAEGRLDTLSSGLLTTMQQIFDLPDVT